MMMAHAWQIAAPGLAMAVAVIGTAALLAPALIAGAQRAGHAMAPVQSLAFAAALVTALLLNANAWIPGRLLFPVMLVAGAVGLGLAGWRGRRDPLSHAALWAAGLTFSSSAIVVGAWDIAFAGRHVWMLEGTNHDLVFFYGGAKWAMEHPLAVSQSFVQSTWEIGQCGQGMQFIGSGCVVQRNGVYSLLALASTFTPDAGPNMVRAMIGACAVFPVLGMLPTLSGRFGGGRWLPRGGLLASVLVLACMGCTGMLLAVVNENIGTAGAAAMVMMLVLWALTPMASTMVWLLMLGTTAGAIGLVYGEAAVHACAIVAIAVFVQARRRRSWGLFIAGGAITLTACVVVLNRQLPELVSSYLQVSGFVAQSEWPSWYIQNRAVWWFASPFAGMLMTAQPPVSAEGVLLGMLLMLVTLGLAVREGRWRFCSGLLLLSALLVGYVQFHGYQYGEHKLIQVLGPAWVALLAWLLARHARRRRATLVVLLVLGALVVLSLGFAGRARGIILSHAPGALTYALADALALPGDGDEVVIDTAAVRGPEKYIKQDFAIIELHRRGARVRMASNALPPVAYSDALFDGSLARASSPDWLLVLRQPGAAPATVPPWDPVAEDMTFALYALDEGRQPVIVSGAGWHQCEASHCWTEGAFTLEAVVPSACRSPVLHLSMAAFQPPAGATVEISTGGGRDTRLTVADNAVVVPLPNGTSTVSVRPDWDVRSPQSLGQSSDARRLFMSVSDAAVQCGLAAPATQ